MKKLFLLVMIALIMQVAPLCAQVAPASDSNTPVAAAAKSGAREVTYRWTDRAKTSRLQFDGSWYFQHESAYTTMYQGKRAAKGKAICTAGLTGKYEFFASFRATENRG